MHIRVLLSALSLFLGGLLLVGCPEEGDDDTSSPTDDDDATSDDDDATPGDDDDATPGDDDDATPGDDDDATPGDDDDATPGDDDDATPGDDDDDDTMTGVDADGDGYADDVDCDDGDASTYPGAPELCDGRDNDCNGSLAAGELDDDADGHMVCDGDCNDSNDTVYPGAPESCDGLDNNCDLIVPGDETDADADGWLLCDGDCDDGDPSVHPGAAEVCNGIDDDCDGTLSNPEADHDGDGFLACLTDCDDFDADVFPGAPEQCDATDWDCDGQTECDDPDCAAEPQCAGGGLTMTGFSETRETNGGSPSYFRAQDLTGTSTTHCPGCDYTFDITFTTASQNGTCMWCYDLDDDVYALGFSDSLGAIYLYYDTYGAWYWWYYASAGGAHDVEFWYDAYYYTYAFEQEGYWDWTGATPEVCDNGIDDDGDGDVDCDDSDCAADPNCAGGGLTMTGRSETRETTGGAPSYFRAQDLVGTSTTDCPNCDYTFDITFTTVAQNGTCAWCYDLDDDVHSLGYSDSLGAIYLYYGAYSSWYWWYYATAGGAHDVEFWYDAYYYTYSLEQEGYWDWTGGTPEVCDNGIDDDGDGDIDCDDSECVADPYCAGTPEVCDNGIDDDLDGDVDCDDADCAADPYCAGGPMTGRAETRETTGGAPNYFIRQDLAGPPTANCPSCDYTFDITFTTVAQTGSCLWCWDLADDTYEMGFSAANGAIYLYYAGYYGSSWYWWYYASAGGAHTVDFYYVGYYYTYEFEQAGYWDF